LSFAQSVTPTVSPTPSTWRRELKQERKEMFENLKEAASKAREEVREFQKESREVRKEARVARATARPTVISEAKKVKFTQRLNDVYNRLLKQAEARYTQLLATKTKIQTRLTEAKAKGVNTAEAEAKLATFSTSQYTTELAAFKAEFTKLSTSTNPGLELGSLRSTGAKVAKDLNDLRKILSDTLRLLIKASK
jgi:DNA polymerase III delta prime subunit